MQYGVTNLVIRISPEVFQNVINSSRDFFTGLQGVGFDIEHNERSAKRVESFKNNLPFIYKEADFYADLVFSSLTRTSTLSKRIVNLKTNETKSFDDTHSISAFSEIIARQNK